MRKCTILGALVGCVLSLDHRVNASVIASDNFESYSAGSTANNLNGGSGFTGAYTSDNPGAVNIATQSLNYTNGALTLSGGSQDLQVTPATTANGFYSNAGSNIDNNTLNRTFPQQTGTVYFSFLLHANTGATSNNEFFQLGFAELHTQQFADSFVFFAPIANEHGDRTVEPVFRLISACCLAMLLSLAAKLSLRGAIAIGAGAQLEPGSLYGPALVTAHHLESEIAGSPRVVVDEELSRYLNGRGYSDHPMIETISLKLAESCRSFICADADGKLVIDFLGHATRQMSEAPIVDMVKPLYEFVRGEHEKFSQLQDKKLTARYKRLLDYVVSRLPIWGVTP